MSCETAMSNLEHVLSPSSWCWNMKLIFLVCFGFNRYPYIAKQRKPEEEGAMTWSVSVPRYHLSPYTIHNQSSFLFNSFRWIKTWEPEPARSKNQCHILPQNVLRKLCIQFWHPMEPYLRRRWTCSSLLFSDLQCLLLGGFHASVIRQQNPLGLFFEN